MERQIIALHGPMGSGKSTVAKILIDHYGFEVHSFAKPLKSMLKCIGLNDEQLYGSLKNEPTPILFGKTPRFAMQTLATEWARDTIHPDLWTNAWKETLPDCDKIVVDDLRFPNEHRTLTELGAYIINIERPGHNKAQHESERYTLDCHTSIINDGTMLELESKIFLIAHEVHEKWKSYNSQE